MGYFTLAHMNVLAKICPPRLSSLVTKLKVGIWLPLALVRATLTDRSHDSRPCSLKVTAELLSTNNWRPLSRQGANILWPGCFGTYECVCKKLSTEIQLSWDQAEGGNLVAVGAGVRATLTGRASHDSGTCGLKVTTESLSTNNWRPLSRQRAKAACGLGAGVTHGWWGQPLLLARRLWYYFVLLGQGFWI